MRSSKTKILVSSSEILKRIFMYKVRRFFKKANAPTDSFLLKALIHRELVQLTCFFIYDASLNTTTSGKLHALVKQVQKLSLRENRLRASMRSLIDVNNANLLQRFYSDDAISCKAKEYLPKPFLKFLHHFLLNSNNRNRLIASSFSPNKTDRKAFMYVLSSESQEDVFLYNRSLSQYLVLQYPCEAFGINQTLPYRQSSVSTPSYRGRRGSYESFDQPPASYIYLLGMGCCVREDFHRKHVYRNVLYNDIRACGTFFRENHPRVKVVLSEFMLLPALKLHPFPNFDEMQVFDQYAGEILIPGTVKMKQVTEMKEGSDIFRSNVFSDVLNYFVETLYAQNIENVDIIKDVASRLSSATMFQVYSAK